MKTSPIPATVLFKPGVCMIGINLLDTQPRFRWDADNILVEDGRPIAWPSPQAKEQALIIRDMDRSRVFVVEFSASGEAVAEHPVT